METNPNPATFFLFGQLDKFITKVAVIVWTQMLGDLDEEY